MKSEIIIKNIENFNLKQIAESGQSFRWQEQANGSFIVTAMNETVHLKEKGNDLIIKGLSEESFKNKWHHYFDLDRDYKKVINDLKGRDQYLDAAIEYGSGIRILNQDLWEIIVTFIISSNNNIPRIKNSIEMLSKKYGTFIKTINGEDYYSFPKAETLSRAKIEDLRACGLGYRDKYILKTSQMVVDGTVDLKEVKKMSRDKGKKELKKLVGVGNKVADCILLFACEEPAAFPVDTWVKKVLADYYDFHEKKQVEINAFVHAHFGEFAGIAQQYLFYYIRKTANLK